VILLAVIQRVRRATLIKTRFIRRHKRAAVSVFYPPAAETASDISGKLCVVVVSSTLTPPLPHHFRIWPRSSRKVHAPGCSPVVVLGIKIQHSHCRENLSICCAPFGRELNFRRRRDPVIHAAAPQAAQPRRHHQQGNQQSLSLHMLSQTLRYSKNAATARTNTQASRKQKTPRPLPIMQACRTDTPAESRSTNAR